MSKKSNLQVINKKNPKQGDVFCFGEEYVWLGYGQVLRSGIIQFVVIFEPLHSSLTSIKNIISSKIVLAGWTSDSRFRSDDWHMIGNAPTRLFPFPEYKVEISGEIWVTNVDGVPLRLANEKEAVSLSLQSSHSPVTFEKAFKAYHKLTPWEERFGDLRV